MKKLIVSVIALIAIALSIYFDLTATMAVWIKIYLRAGIALVAIAIIAWEIRSRNIRINWFKAFIYAGIGWAINTFSLLFLRGGNISSMDLFFDTVAGISAITFSLVAFEILLSKKNIGNK
ncbi:MAG: hypothetical protein ABIJ91_05590 [Candidatus Kuenenbacteria bacterium]